MPKEYSSGEIVEQIAQRLLGTFHTELATARIKYVMVDKAGMKNGIPILGKVRKLSGILEYFIEADFLVEVPIDQFNPLTENARVALVDHLLERMTGVEDEENSGKYTWKTREPEVQEFSSILRRHGVWNEQLKGFVQVAHSIEIEDLVQEVVDTEATEDVTVQN